MLSTTPMTVGAQASLRILLQEIFLSLLILAIPAVGGCSAPAVALDENREISFWPQFPSEPHMQFLVSFRYSSDIEAPKGRFDALIYGEESTVLPINKPYGVQMFEGKIYVCDIKNPGVVVLDLEKKQTRVMATRGLGGMSQPTDITITPDGMKYVADSVRGVIFVFDEDERHVKSFGHEGFKPVGIAHYEDRLYVTDFATQSVIVMDRFTGEIIQSIGGPGNDDGQFIRPLGIDTDTDGNIYVCDVIKCRLQKFDPQGKLLSATGEIGDTAGSFVRPKHIAVDETGIVYVADAAFDNVQMFNKNGDVLMFFGSGGSHPGAMNLPAGVSISEKNIEYFEQYIHPAFKAERLVIITNQFGPDKVAVYAMGQLAEGRTIEDIASAVSDMASGVQTEDAPNPLTGNLTGAPESSESEADPTEDPSVP